MLLSPRIGLKSLAQLCHRLATATSAGLDDRRIWRSEADRGGRAQREAVRQVSDALARGESIAAALAPTGEYFPGMFRQIVAIGDASGQLDNAYKRLAQHYDHMLAARRALRSALAWPLIQLSVATLTIGFVIWISATLRLRNADGEPLDMFGLGLTGTSGLVTYILIVLGVIIGAWLLLRATRRGALWTQATQRAALRVPGMGDAFKTLALARFTWAMQLVLDTSMDLRTALPLALEASGNAAFARLGPEVARSIQSGMTLYEALAVAGDFPADLLDAISVGEQSGMLAETMQRQAKEYEERSATAINLLGQTLGYLVWALVAGLIILLIFRVFSTYVGTINSLTR